jgi:hypothetical protein
VSGSGETRWIEFVDHLHAHFRTLQTFTHRDGPAWRTS